MQHMIFEMLQLRYAAFSMTAFGHIFPASPNMAPRRRDRESMRLVVSRFAEGVHGGFVEFGLDLLALVTAPAGVLHHEDGDQAELGIDAHVRAVGASVTEG